TGRTARAAAQALSVGRAPRACAARLRFGPSVTAPTTARAAREAQGRARRRRRGGAGRERRSPRATRAVDSRGPRAYHARMTVTARPRRSRPARQAPGRGAPVLLPLALPQGPPRRG